MNFQETITQIGHIIAFTGVMVMVTGMLVAGVQGVRELIRKELSSHEIYTRTRQRVGRGLVLGLEVLVAADIIETVAIEPTFNNIGVLALIVAVRTFLGWSLAVELEGRWPWQKSMEKEMSMKTRSNHDSDTSR